MLHSVLLLLVAAGAAAKEIVVTFPDRGPGYPKGTITLSQASAFDDLTITTALSNMENSAAGNAWQVNSFPTLMGGGTTEEECGPAVTLGLFNPTFAATGGIGDLTSKHGKLAQSQGASYATYVDTTASIIYDPAPGTKGNKWIVGRSIVIQKADGSIWACANIGSGGMAAIVRFPDEGPGKPQGGIQLFQASAADTTAMTVDVMGLQVGNKFHVHTDPVPPSGECGALATGGHFDPAGANYSSGNAPPPYEYGDLSGKHGKLNAASGGSFVGTGRGFVTDATLPLSGDWSVVGRSIVIHRTDGSRWTCADIAPQVLPCPKGCTPVPQTRRLLFGIVPTPTPAPPTCPPGCQAS